MSGEDDDDDDDDDDDEEDGNMDRKQRNAVILGLHRCSCRWSVVDDNKDEMRIKMTERV